MSEQDLPLKSLSKKPKFIIKKIVQIAPFSKLSYDLTKNIDLNTKKKNGIYFTPYKDIDNSIKFIQNFCNTNNIILKDILEPSCGSCEFIRYLDDSLQNINIHAVELNDIIYNSITKLQFNNNVKIFNSNYLDYNNNKKYDLIIGNPPFFVMKKSDVNTKYYSYFDGRPNIFILFIIHSLDKLKENGILSFILPVNFTNCLYYNKLRKYIYTNFTILNLQDCNSEYIDTCQDTIIFILQNKKPQSLDSNFVFTKSEYVIFNTINKINSIKKLYENSVTLDTLDMDVSVGTVVWNQVKSELTNDNSKTRLIYNSDIVDNKLIIKKYKDPDKKNYINHPGLTSPQLVINRGYGKGDYIFNYCIINMDKSYLIENHLICITHKTLLSNKQELINLYNKIINSFTNKKTKEFVKLYFGNNAINTTELKYILPIYIN